MDWIYVSGSEVLASPADIACASSLVVRLDSFPPFRIAALPDSGISIAREKCRPDGLA